jgi:hypothetical protein
MTDEFVKDDSVQEESTLPEIPAEAAEKTEDVQTEAPAEAAQEGAEKDARSAAVDEMEKAAQKALESMREQDNDRSDEVVDEAEEKLDNLFDDFRNWLKTNTEPEHVKEEFGKFTAETAKILNATKEKAAEVANSEQFKKTMESGKDFITGTGTMIGDGLKYGYSKLMDIPEFKKAADKVETGVDDLRKNEKLKDFVEGTEKGISRFNESVFAGIKSFFKEAEPAKTEEKPEEEKAPEAPAEETKADSE